MKHPVRMTYTTAAVLVALEAGLEYGFDISAATGLRRGTTYPILRRLEDAGLIRGVWEDPSIAHTEKRPARRYYRLTASGHQMASDALGEFPMLQVQTSDGQS